MSATDRIVTIEGLSPNSSHPVQKAWAAVDVPQCGYCQSGQIMAAAALLKRTPKPTDTDIDEAMTNICRCGTYQRIRAAVHMAANDTSQNLKGAAMNKIIRNKSAKLSRRKFVVGSAAAGGGLALGFNLPSGFGAALAQGAPPMAAPKSTSGSRSSPTTPA